MLLGEAMGDREVTKNPSTLRFGDFSLQPERAALWKGDREVKLRPKVYDALHYLIANRGRLVPKEELIQALWPEAFVTDDSLVQCMVELRRALDDRSQEILKTVPRRGYIFAAEVDRDTGPAESRAQAKAAAGSDIATAHRLPIARTPLLGRERELAAVGQLLLDPAVHLVTLTGAGGSGKTRLGMELCRELSGAFEQHVYVVALGSISDAGMVPAAIAESLGIREIGGRPYLDLAMEFLRECEPSPVLLLLDNLEHILPASAFVVQLIEASRGLKILVTSRAPLRVYGEHEFPVPPLALPDPQQMHSLAALAENPSISLFAQRAAAVKPDFQLTAENAPAVAEICSRVDGLPLAIELAAARVKMLPLSGILARLQSRLQLLTAGARDLPERQQTLRNTIDWSYDLLNEAEQKLLRRLAVFWGGGTLEAAEAVGNTSNDLGAEIFEVLSSLVDKSLIQQRQQGSDEPRFRMLETIREYALERLKQSGEEAATKRAHAAYSLVLAEEGNPDLTESERAAWLARCEAEHDDFRAALDWMFQTRELDWGFRFCMALFRFWDMREHSEEGRARLQHILQIAGSDYPRERARIYLFLGAFSTAQGDFTAAARFLQQSLNTYQELDDPSGIAVSLNAMAIAARDRGDHVAAQNNFEKSLAYWRKAGDRAAIARCLHNLGNVARIRGDYARARMALSEAMQLFEEIGDSSGAAWALNQQGDVAKEQRDLAGAREHYEKALAAFRGAADRWGMARSLADLGTIACEHGDQTMAYAAFKESLEIFTALEHRRGIARVLEGFACLALRKGDAHRALAVAGAASRLRQAISAPLPPGEQAILDENLRQAWEQLGEAGGKKAWEEGRALTTENAIKYALSVVSS
ncbi:MAG TPA: tetratricopeptide repeat protein [Candidatus Sulfotelmatobacter sp.]|nr:tetratricopeptide repeat protein [Candidatus Sulfotelmatobacter sp.]